jgi:hypothetical protein
VVPHLQRQQQQQKGHKLCASEGVVERDCVVTPALLNNAVGAHDRLPPLQKGGREPGREP